MLPFFRKIRYRLAKDNQFFKYSRYAIGEIVLVVIGILLALYINNWNEERKEREKFDQVLVEVEKELITNIENCRSYLDYLFDTDSIVSLVLHEDLTFDDYMNNPSFLYIQLARAADIKDDEFQKLIAINPKLTKEQDSLMLKLKRLQTAKREIGHDFERVEDNYEAFKKELQQFEWYTDYEMVIMNDEIIDFMANNSLYKKLILISAEHLLFQTRSDIEEFEMLNREVYSSLFNYLNSRNISHADSLLFHYNSNDFKHYKGVYEMFERTTTWNENLTDSTVISVENDKLFYAPYYKDGTNSKREVIPISKNNFRTERGSGYFRLIFDENDKVTECHYSNGVIRIKLKKIR